jgi:hypothetical protein
MCLRVDMAYNPHLRRQVASFIEGGVILAVYRNRKRRPIARNLHPVTLVLEGSVHWRPGMSRDPHSSNYIRPIRARLYRQKSTQPQALELSPVTSRWLIACRGNLSVAGAASGENVLQEILCKSLPLPHT